MRWSWTLETAVAVQQGASLRQAHLAVQKGASLGHAHLVLPWWVSGMLDADTETGAPSGEDVPALVFLSQSLQTHFPSSGVKTVLC